MITNVERHEIAEILLKLALNKPPINQSTNAEIYK